MKEKSLIGCTFGLHQWDTISFAAVESKDVTSCGDKGEIGATHVVPCVPETAPGQVARVCLRCKSVQQMIKDKVTGKISWREWGS